MKYEPHELSLAFPEMPAEQYRRFAESIRSNGLNNPIVLFEGKILDGRHRYRACAETGVRPRFREFREGDETEASHGDPVAYVQSENAARRHLSESQLAYSITHPNILEFERRRAKERMALAGTANLGMADRPTLDDPGPVTEKLAAKAGVGARSVGRAIKVREQGTEEVNEAVASGEISLNMAEKIVSLNPAAQKRVVEAPKQARADVLREAINRSESKKKKEPRNVIVEPGTPFVRKFLSGIESLAMACAGEGQRDAAAIATRFLSEMDWNSHPLVLQLERCQPVYHALNIIYQRQQKAA